MFAVLRILLLSVHLLHFKTTLAEDVPSIRPTAATTTTTLSDQILHTKAVESLAASNATFERDFNGHEDASLSAGTARQQRQLLFDPSLFLLQASLANAGIWEGSRCLTSRAQPGSCVRIDNCRSYYRVVRQLSILAVRQWQPPVGSLGFGSDICNFYDQLGRINNGICCPSMDTNPLGGYPMPTTTTTTTTTTEKPPVGVDEIEEADDVEEPDQPQDNLNPDENDKDPIDTVQNSVEDMPDFQDINHIEANAPELQPAPTPSTTLPTTAVNPYQWPFGNFAGGFPQWPPPLPTHPPSVGGWPPPIPTHPPNHQYPTHPTSRPIGTTTSSGLTTRRTTPRPQGRPPTTTRRPSYPTTATTTSTTRRPTTGYSPEGLPLQCGNKNPVSPDQERIVGGNNASPHEFPWMAVLFKSGKQFCGGSLITNNHILTAAHCVARMTSWDVAALTAHLGDYNIRTDFEVQHVSRRIKRLVRHKGFEFSTLHNDIAILTLSEPVPFSTEIQPICLPTSATQKARSYSGQVATVAGWGSLRENGPQPSILQKVDIPIWTNSECAHKYGRAAPGGIIESMICAGQASKDSCSGDSGGPMIVNEGNRYTQVGIVSWGIGCGKGQYPGVYTRVTSLLPWIYKNIK
ncbi:PREDICTED: transmembrane protease serine 9 [Drosophila arizonae]|uniref:Transmembrane protease serine 9 n=1 Tax=Drosophila arizonae TaxID=7263 RepID=A0ABM1NZD8_DROAR|nr:PREDICTED: transmembrane protease serine 9 [Drosophila arizonae]